MDEIIKELEKNIAIYECEKERMDKDTAYTEYYRGRYDEACALLQQLAARPAAEGAG